MSEASSYLTELACYKRQINDVTNPEKNHPIHDAVERISYGHGRYDMAIVLDGVSESKSQKLLVPIGRMLNWDLARFCQQENPTEIEALAEWFAGTTRDPRYQGQGNTTVAVIRFDHETGVIDGFNAGDSPVLLALDRLRPGDDGELVLKCAAEVLSPMHCVANSPGMIYNGWRFGVDFEPSTFRCDLPGEWVHAYCIAMSDGYGKISDEVASELYDYNEADQILAARAPDFARVYLPEKLVPMVPEVRRSPEGRVLRQSIAHRDDLWEAIARYYDTEATEEERRELEVMDLDCLALAQLVRAPQDTSPIFNGRSAQQVLESSHRSLTWMTRARYLPNEDEVGLEEYLRQYVMAELFVEAMISEMYETAGGEDELHVLLHNFGESLGPIADDFSVSLIRIQRAASGA